MDILEDVEDYDPAKYTPDYEDLGGANSDASEEEPPEDAEYVDFDPKEDY